MSEQKNTQNQAQGTPVNVQITQNQVHGTPINVQITPSLVQSISQDVIEESVFGNDSSFEEKAKKIVEPNKAACNIGCLVQRTIYPDIMESGADGHKQIKAHHNVGGMAIDIRFEAVIELIKYLYKEEVRDCGRKLGLPGG